MAMSFASISHATSVAGGLDSTFELRFSSSGSPWSTRSTVSFRNCKPGIQGVPRASLATDVWGVLSARFTPKHIQHSSYAKLDRFLGSKKFVRLAAVPSDVATIEETVESEKSSEEGLVNTLLSLVKDTDRGAALDKEKQSKVADVVNELEKFSIPEPLQSPFIFGDWDVAYGSNPTSPGGLYRSWMGRLIFRTRELIQTIISPDVVVNVVRFAFLGFIPGEVMLKGKLEVLGQKLVQVDFEPPSIQTGPFKFTYGRESTVKLSIIYLTETLRLGRGSRGTIFVFTRRLIK